MIGEVVVLGSGTSNGVPTLGVDYTPEYLANPKNHRTRPSILIRGSGGNVLVDCTPEMRLQLLREQVKSIEAVIVTHTHADHIMGMDDLRSFSLRSGSDMRVYAQPEDQAVIRRVFSYAFEDFPPGVHVPRYQLIDPAETIEEAGLSIRTFRVWHGKWPVLALRVGDFAYVTDVNRIPEDAWSALQGLETLVLDAVRYKPHPNHYSFDEAMDVAARLAPKMTYFTHLSHDYDHDLTESGMPPNVRLAYDGLRISI